MSPRTPAPPRAPRDQPATPAAPRSRTSARGPLLLLLAGTLAAAVIAAAQVFGLAWPAARPASAANTAQPRAGGDAAVHTLEELRARYGDPRDATAGRMRIPAINVDAPIGSRVVAKDGVLQDPTGASDVVWYDFAGLPGLGGTPGGGGNAVFAGHVDRVGYLEYAGIDYSGPGIFFWLDRLSPGDVIEVTMNGKTLRYAVTWVREVPASDERWSQLLGSNVGGESITLVTCGGAFDHETREYASRLVVRAIRA